MAWQELAFDTNLAHHEAISVWLQALGAVAITLLDAQNEPLLEPAPDSMPVWQHVHVQALFTDDYALDEIIPSLPSPLQQQITDVTIRVIEDQVWERTCLVGIKPLSFGNRLWICPSQHTVTVSNACIVELDPGLAFGTGTHPTTDLCLQWLDQHIQGNETIIDYGCGSGILAIAALKLGARQAWAIDHDPQALQATQDNAHRNQIAEAAIVIQNTQTTLTPAADILIANILAGPLQDLANAFASLVKPQGALVLSGILHDQLATLQQAYEPYFAITHVAQLDDWLRVDAIRHEKAVA